MSDTNGNGRRPLNVLAVIEKKDRPTIWMKLGVAFPNRDGSITLYLDAVPIGTNKLQIREEREWAPRAPANGNGHVQAAPPAFGDDEAESEAVS